MENLQSMQRFTLDLRGGIVYFCTEKAFFAGVAQLVEHKLPKLGVAGSNPVARSTWKAQVFHGNRLPLLRWRRVLPRAGLGLTSISG